MYDKRDYLGIFLFGAGILMLLWMFVSPISNVFIHVDEYWTYTLMNLPFMDAMNVIIHDVHPPLYYWILYIFSPFGLENLYVLKVASIIPYILVMGIALTKIRRDYGWLTAGLFIFCIGIMSDFFVEYLTIRMYSWGLVFVLLAFLYYNEVTTNWDKRSWVLLTVFTLLSAYTQYFFAITCALMYLLILVEILRNHKDKLRQFGKSVLAIIILYAPWAVVFVYQLKTQVGGYHEGLNPVNLIHFMTYFAIKADNFRPDTVAFKLIAAVFLILLLVLIYKKREKLPAAGVFLLYATIIIGVLGLMSSFCNTMRVRYLIPVIGVFWLSASIVIGRIENNKILAVMLILIMALAGASLIITEKDIDSRLTYNDKKADFLSTIDNNDTVVVFNTDYGYRVLHDDIHNAQKYSIGDTYFYSNDTKICNNLTKIMHDNPGKKIYLVNWANKDINKEYENNYTLVEKYDAGHFTINLVKR